MKPVTLLLTGSVPGSAHVGEIILRDLAVHHGPERMPCVAVVPAKYRGTVDPGLDGMRVRLLRSPHTHGMARGTGSWVSLKKRLRFVAGFQREVSRLAEEVVASAREAGVQQVFAVLNNALTIALAHRVSDALGVPLVTLVWDPPEYLFRQARFDRWSRTALHREFRKSLAGSVRVAVVSETMQRDFAAFTRAPIHLLRHGLDFDDAVSGTALLDDEWLIGFAGSMYSDGAWKALTGALDHVGWRVAGRPVRLRLLTGRILLSSRRSARVDYLGFRPVSEVQRLLGECHLTYMPQPFESEFADLCRYSFPTKLANYLSLGRPVLVHCPDDSALAEFFRQHPVGVHVPSLEPDPIVEALEALLGDEPRYARAGANASSLARSEFSAKAFRAAVDRVLGTAVVGGTPA
jgi:glycosyltransferase involved in cell wall biosynthesis